MEKEQATKERQNRLRQWLAIVLALVIIAQAGTKTTPKESPSLGERLNQWAEQVDSNALNEVVIEAGDEENRILVISMHGPIGLPGGGLFGSDDFFNQALILDALEEAQKDPTVRGVLLDIDSPGGAVYDTVEVYQRLLAYKEATDVPIYASIGSQGASGAYYLAVSADKIFAAEESVVGSIGVMMSMSDWSELYDKIGIKTNTFTTGTYKDTGSNTRSMTEDEKEYLASYIDASYQRFLDAIEEGRPLTRQEIEDVADGRIFDGVQALELKLIDALGFKKEALEQLIEDVGVSYPEVFEYEQGGEDWLGGFPFKLKKLLPNLQQPAQSELYFLRGGV